MKTLLLGYVIQKVTTYNDSVVHTSARRIKRMPLLGVSSAVHRAGLDHVRLDKLRHTLVTRMLNLSVPIEQINYIGGH